MTEKSATQARKRAAPRPDQVASVKELHERLWKTGYGSISAAEAEFLAAAIDREKPASFVEIGTATGLSTVLIATALQRNGAGALTTIDYSKKFYGDLSKNIGFLVDEHFGEGSGGIRRLTGLTSADLATTIEGPVGMAFIDANHGHPWPTLDTLMIWPFLAEGALLFHHDLRSYQKFGASRSCGPKYLYDSIPDSQKTVIADVDRNMFWLRKNIEAAQFARRLTDCLLLPWDSAGRIGFLLARRIHDQLQAQYPPIVAHAFAIGFDRAKT